MACCMLDLFPGRQEELTLRALVCWVCVVRAEWRLGAQALDLPCPSHLSQQAPTVHRLPSSRLCSPTTPQQTAQGTAGDVAPSECDSLMRPTGTQPSATGSAAVLVRRQDGEPWDSGRAGAMAHGPGSWE